MSKLDELILALERKRRKAGLGSVAVLPPGHDLGIVAPAFTPEQILCVERTFNDALGAVPRVGEVWFVDVHGAPMSTVVRCVGTPRQTTEFPFVGIEVNCDEEPVATADAIPCLLRVAFANSNADQDPSDFNFNPNVIIPRGQRMLVRCLDMAKYQAAVAEADEAFRWE